MPTVSKIRNSFTINMMISMIIFMTCLGASNPVLWGFFVAHLCWVAKLIYR